MSASFSMHISPLQIFDVVLNHEHIVVPNLDIFARVGRGVALDVVVPFRIKSNMVSNSQKIG